MMASIGGYRSPVNLGLGRIPMTTDAELFDEFTGVYNAIHLINQYLDRLRNSADGGGSGQTPAETMPFNRFFTAVAGQTITAGQPVSPNAIAGQNVHIKGALPHLYTSTVPENNFCGIALDDAGVGNDFRVGVGPAVLQVPGAVTGSLIWAYSQRSITGIAFDDGGLYLNNPGPKTVSGKGTAYPMPVGITIASGYVMFGKFIKRV